MGPSGTRIAALLLALTAGVLGQKEPVSQDQSVLAKEGGPIQLNCSYRETATSVHWYKQSPDGQMESLALLHRTTSEPRGRFVVSLNTASRTASVYLDRTRLGDAAVYFCALSHSGVRCQVEVNQSPLVFTREGETSTIACKYETSNFYSLQWYRQFPGERPTHLLTIVGKEVREGPSFSAGLDKVEKSSRLNITGVQRRDAATYFCAVEAQ
ncbi:UNVERIFIED_CONTAM: hypothetical protein K2H54_045046 [Gekko kuhli]